MTRQIWILTTALLTAALLPAADKSVFEGKWVMDKKNSPNAALAPDDLTQQIRIKGSAIAVQSRWKEPKSGVYKMDLVGLTSTEVTLPTDGTESEFTVGPYTMKAKSSMSGNTMTTDWTTTIKDVQRQGQWIRTISDDGKQMTLQIKGTSSDGNNTDASLLFKRK